MSGFSLAEAIGSDSIVRETMRKGFGRGLVRAGEADETVVALCADLTDSVQMGAFQKRFGDRFIQVGIAEQNMVTVAAGLAAQDKKPFVGSYAAFSPGRNWEQIRTTVCLNERPVCIVGSHAGFSVGADGATHQMLEDIALMRSLPHMTVVAPADSVEAEKATLALAVMKTPSYLRLSRESTPVYTTHDSPFELGRAYVLREGHDVTILSTGIMTYQCLLAAKQLDEQGIAAEIIHVPTIKPLDADTILMSVKKTGRAVTVEEGQIAAGFGSAVTELTAERLPLPVMRLGVQDKFGESGTTDELLDAFGLSALQIAKSVRSFCEITPKYHQGG